MTSGGLVAVQGVKRGIKVLQAKKGRGAGLTALELD